MTAEPPPPPIPIVETMSIDREMGVGMETEIEREIRSIRAEIAAMRRQETTAHVDRIRRSEIQAMIATTLATTIDGTTKQGLQPEPPWHRIVSRDGNFSLDLAIYTQVNWIANRTSAAPTDHGFEIGTVRITFAGSIIDPSLTYATRLTVGDQGLGTLEFATFQKQYDNGVMLQAGLIEPQFSLEQAIDNNQQLGVGLSFTAGQWDPSALPGLSIGWTSDDFRAWGTYSNDWGRSYVDVLRNQRQTVIGRAEWKPFGDWTDLYDFNAYPETIVPGMLLGVGGAFGWGATDIGGPNEADGDATRLTADVSLQSPGLGGMATISWQSGVPGTDLSGGGERLAVVGQAGWFLDPTVEVYARGEWGTPLLDGVEDLRVFTVGASWMPRSNRMIKVSAEFMQVLGDARYWAIDGDPGIRQVETPQSIVRAQLQLSF